MKNLPALVIEEDGTIRDTVTQGPFSGDPHELINPAALVARLQAHALGQAIEPGGQRVFMDNTEIAAARTLLERVMVRAEALPKPETPALERTEIASNISDDEALKAYLAMLG